MTSAERMRQEGMELGMEKGLAEIAQKMFRHGLDFSIVLACVALPAEKLLALQRQVQAAS